MAKSLTPVETTRKGSEMPNQLMVLKFYSHPRTCHKMYHRIHSPGNIVRFQQLSCHTRIACLSRMGKAGSEMGLRGRNAASRDDRKEAGVVNTDRSSGFEYHKESVVQSPSGHNSRSSVYSSQYQKKSKK
jgi:hypothetical protein